MLRVVPKPTGKTPDGNPADLEALVIYIRQAAKTRPRVVVIC